MNVTVTKDGRYLSVEGMSILEKEQLNLYFTKKVPDWYIIKKVSPYANIEESFVYESRVLPGGLWIELCNMAKKYGYQLTFDENFSNIMMDPELNLDSFKVYVDNLFKDAAYKPKDYQTAATYSLLKYKKACVEVSTNGGKTLICYLLFKYLRERRNIKHILYITPKTVLTKQSSDKFKEYDAVCGVPSDWEFDEIHGDAKKKTEYKADIVFGNYQSLAKKKQDFFKIFDCVIVDEAHHAGTAQSIQTILNKCTKAEYKIGLTGTFPKEGTYENFQIQTFIGPLVYRLTSYELIKVEKFSTPVHIYGVKLDYLTTDKKKELHGKRMYKDREDPTAGNTLLNEEHDIARNSKLRFDWLCDFVGKFNRNTLVVFIDKKNQYGYKIYTKLKESTKKNVFYIDGNTDTKVRDKIKQGMEDDTTGNTVIVASIGCFSEGIDIANLWNIVLAESMKSEIIIAQLLGRGMRRYEGKPMTKMFDIYDDFSYGNDYYKDNYLLKHFKERERIYRQRKFDYMGVVEVNLNQSELY